MKRIWFYLVALGSGACVMMLEMIGFRMFAPHFGYSVYVTGAMISVILLSMSIGYVLGGWLADRSQTSTPMFLVLLAGAISLTGLIFVYQPLLLILQTKGLLLGTLLGSFLLFTLPMLLLAVPSPFLIKLLANKNVGTTAGRIVALSTLGSIVGTLVASFFLIPTYGVKTSLVITACFVWVLSTLGLALRHVGALLLLLLLPTLRWVPAETIALPQGTFRVLADIESAYSRLIVVQDKHQKLISVMPSYNFVQSEKRMGGALKLTSSELDSYSLGGLLQTSPKRFLLLGLGAGTSFQQLRHFFPNVWIDGVDIDPKIVDIGKRFFGLRQDQKSKFYIQDARRFVQNALHKYDMIAINLTAGSIFIPFYMATKQAFRRMRSRLHRQGWLLMNIVDISPKKELASCILHTAHAVWKYVYSLPIGGNVVMLASQTPFSSKLLLQNAKKPHRKLLRSMVDHSLAKIKPWNSKRNIGCKVWTDDHSRLESYTFKTLKVLHP